MQNKWMKSVKLLGVALIVSLMTGCGYSTKSLLPSNYKTIYVPQFENQVTYLDRSNRSLYIPLLEVKVRDKITDRYLFDGNLRVTDSQSNADLILKGKLLGYERDELRLSDDNDVEEYRIHIVVALELWDPTQEAPLWTENKFYGETTYFTTGPNAISESVAQDNAMVDLARRVVERTIENW